MALYSFNISNVSRRKKGSAAKSIAYICRSQLHNFADEKLFDFTHKKDLLFHEIVLPESSPKWFHDLQTFSNEIEKSEKRIDSRLLRSITAALPNEIDFSLEDYIIIVRVFIAGEFTVRSMGAIYAIHEGKNHEHPERNNPHVHILLTTRSIDETGFSIKKSVEFNSKNSLLRLRKMWELIINRSYELKHLPQRVSSLSYEIQRLIDDDVLLQDLKPMKHMGNACMEMEKRMMMTEKGDFNRDVLEKRKQKKLEREKKMIQTQKLQIKI